MKHGYAMTAIATALLAFATTAGAVDLHGYFRQGFGGSSKGGDQVTFTNAGQEYKLRLGNESDWSEWEFSQPVLKDANGVEWSAGFMISYSDNFSQNQSLDTNDGDFHLKQSYVKAMFPQLGGATVWGGKRYYHRYANDNFDYNMLDDTVDAGGVGIENVDVGFGKLSVAVWRKQPAGESYVSYWMPDVRLESIPVNPGGTLNVAVLAYVRSWNKDANNNVDSPDKTSDFSPVIAVRHNQQVLNGFNNFFVSYRQGCAADVSNVLKQGRTVDLSDPTTDSYLPDCQEDSRKVTVSEELVLQPTKQLAVAVNAMYQNYGVKLVNLDKSYNANAFAIGTRPLFKLTDHFALQGDIGYFYFKADKDIQRAVTGDDKANTMVKLTVAPTITPFTDGFAWGVRPEIRLYGTYAAWNSEQKDAGLQSATWGTDSNGFTFGSYVEAWF